MSYNKVKLDSAINAAREAGRLILDNMDSIGAVISKGKNDIVTEIDTVSEKLITDYLGLRFPEDNFYGEELGRQTGGDGGRWIIDPIDGTENFVRAIPDFTISIAYEDPNGDLAAGVVYNPSQDILYHALKGEGAFLNGKPIKVSGIRKPSDSVAIVAPPFRRHGKAALYFKILETIFAQIKDIRRFGSAAQDLCYIASGKIDAFFELGLHYYDIAAGLIILTEAGGEYSGFTIKENVIRDGNLIATNKFLHAWYKKQIRDIIEEQSGE